MMPRTIIEKIWDRHVVKSGEGKPDLLYIDLHLIHEVTSPQAFEGLRQRILWSIVANVFCGRLTFLPFCLNPSNA